jgi:hypothetical protein
MDQANLQTVVAGAGASPGAAAATVKLNWRCDIGSAACRWQAVVVHGVVRACACAVTILLPVAGLWVRWHWRRILQLRLRYSVASERRSLPRTASTSVTSCPSFHPSPSINR